MFSFFKKNNHWQSLDAKRIECLKTDLPNQIKLNLSQPLPDQKTLVKSLSLLVVDFETTGFEPKINDIISIGWVGVVNMQVDLETKHHFYIDNSQHITHETAVINQIVPQMVKSGRNIEQAINILLDYAKGKVLIVHGKVIEKSFIDFYAQKYLGIPELPLMWIDTMKIEEWKTAKTGGNTISQDNRLSAVRKRYGLPQYNAHNALVDSIATAELLLAQIAHLYRDKNVTLQTLYEISQ